MILVSRYAGREICDRFSQLHGREQRASVRSCSRDRSVVQQLFKHKGNLLPPGEALSQVKHSMLELIMPTLSTRTRLFYFPAVILASNSLSFNSNYFLSYLFSILYIKFIPFLHLHSTIAYIHYITLHITYIIAKSSKCDAS